MINPNVTYLEENLPKQRYSLLQGSTRSGKTRAVIDYLLLFCQQHGGVEIGLTRETFKALKATAWKDFENVLKEYGMYNPDDHNKTDGVYRIGSNVLTYFGSDSHDKVHGSSRDILWVNEAQLTDQEVVDQLFPRTRHKIICDFNPALGDEHWLDKYMEINPPFITTYKDNPFLTQSQIVEIESRKDNPYWWSVYGEGKRAKVEGAVFTNWEKGAFSGDYWFGMDFGYSNDPTALVRVSLDRKNGVIYLKEELYETHLTTGQIFEIASKACGKSLIIADSSEPRLIAELRSKGLNIQGAKKGQGSVNEGVMLMNDYKIIAEGKNLHKELSKYKWADKGRTMPIDDYNHAIDAARYGITFKLTRPNYGKYALK